MFDLGTFLVNIGCGVYLKGMAEPYRPLLREARRAAGLTQTQLADLLGVAQQHVARWETGRVEPRARIAVRVSEALGTTVNALWPPEPDESEPA